MSVVEQQAEWYYVGQYGELGPLSLDQMKDLIQDKVIGPETFVWRTGMTDWVQANTISELRSRISAGMTTPPPPPPPSPARPPSPALQAPYTQSYVPRGYPEPLLGHPAQHGVDWNAMESQLPKSDKSRITAGLLSLIPGAGRLYLGYSAHGAMQIITFVFCFVGLLWSWIDCFYILLGGVKYDGYGRKLDD